ncbi:MAG: DinB family protein, partial [Planctomycetota bacterium]
ANPMNSVPTLESVRVELEEILRRVTPMLAALDPESISRRSGPKKWSKKEILGHLIDSAANNHQKFVRLLSHTEFDFPGYAQEDWAAVQMWADADFDAMQTLWLAYNRHLAFLISQIPSEAQSNCMTIDGVGPFRLDFIVSDYVEHLKHHLRQIFPDAGFETRFENVYHR